MKKKSKNKNVLIIGILILILLVGCYFILNKDHNILDNNGNNGGSNREVITSLMKFALSSDNLTVSFNGQDYAFKFVDSSDGYGLYINDQLIKDVTANYVYLTNNMIFFTGLAQCDEVITYILNKDNQKVENDIINIDSNLQFMEIYLEDDKLIGVGRHCPCYTEGQACYDKKVEIIYNSKDNKLTMKEI